MLLNIYQKNNSWPVQKYEKAKFLLPVPQTTWGIYSISQTSILLEFFFGVLVPASGRHSLSFSILIKLLHTPSALILAHSYFYLRDSLSCVPWVYKNSPHPSNLRRQTRLWPWREMLRDCWKKRREHWGLSVFNITTLESILELEQSLNHATWIHNIGKCKDETCHSYVWFFSPHSWKCLIWKRRSGGESTAFLSL